MKSELQEEYKIKKELAEYLEHPRVLVNICSHGNETLGLAVRELCKNIELAKGSITFNVCNPKAVMEKKRFIESDLNRSFPGSESGTHEEKIAKEMLSYIPLFDYFFDIHSTGSDNKNSLIYEDNLSEIHQLISACRCAETALYISSTSGTSIFKACRLADKIIPGMAFEYGDNSDETAGRTFADLRRMFISLGLVENDTQLEFVDNKIRKYECYSVFPRNSDDLIAEGIENYKLVKRGDIVANSSDGRPIIAPEDFYPVLFGEPNYTTIFGFMAKESK